MNFEIIIDDFFKSFNKDAALSPIEKKKVLSLINDYEDGQWRY